MLPSTMTTSAHTSRTRKAAAPVQPMLKLSLAVEPLVSIVQRHVKISGKARQAIVRDLARALGQADVQLLVGGAAAEGQSGGSDPVLTTEQAARLAGVSRPYMARLIDTGAVALHKRVGKQRRVLRSSVSAWQQAERTRQVKSLKRLARDLDEEIFPT